MAVDAEAESEVVVLGSANLDVALRVAALPQPGETVLARQRTTGPGGKGANQAVAAARSGARTAFLGAVGDDADADVLRAALSDAGVDVSALRTARSVTGAAYVLVDDVGENAIVVHGGANAGLADLDAAELAVVGRARVLLCSLEVPLPPVTAAVRSAHAAGVVTVLNAAPAQPLPAELTAALDVLVVNEQEALAVAGVSGAVEDAVTQLLERVPEVVVTLGARGALVGERGQGTGLVPAVRARAVVDTTGAGDVFCGALAAARARGLSLRDAASYACAAASLAVEQAGAAASAPTREQTERRQAGR